MLNQGGGTSNSRDMEFRMQWVCCKGGGDFLLDGMGD